MDETLKGNVVLSIGVNTKCSDPYCEIHGSQSYAFTKKNKCRVPDLDKEMLDELHLRKIDLADEVLILNPGKYR
jgi:hypothetical protein